MGMMFRVLLAMLLCASAQAQTKFITVASTTSTEQSGLFKHLLPAFEKKAGFQVRVVALGTGRQCLLALLDRIPTGSTPAEHQGGDEHHEQA